MNITDTETSFDPVLATASHTSKLWCMSSEARFMEGVANTDKHTQKIYLPGTKEASDVLSLVMMQSHVEEHRPWVPTTSTPSCLSQTDKTCLHHCAEYWEKMLFVLFFRYSGSSQMLSAMFLRTLNMVNAGAWLDRWYIYKLRYSICSASLPPEQSNKHSCNLIYVKRLQTK